MDYEKKYKEALEKFRKDLGKHELVGVNRAYLEDIFPELKESEDEKIREQVVYAINQLHVCECTKNKLLAWLKKQGKQKIIENADDEAEKYAKTLYCSNLEAVNGIGNCSACENVKFAFKAGIEKQGETSPILSNSSNIGKDEQKPADLKTKAGNWYVCDMEVMNENMVTAFHRGEVYYCPKDGYIDVNGALFEVGTLDVFRLATKEEIPQQKPTWSEEDGKYIDGLIRGLTAKRDIHKQTTFSSDNLDITNTINWLSSLKDKVRFQWECYDDKGLDTIADRFIPEPTWNALEESKGEGSCAAAYDYSQMIAMFKAGVQWLKSLRPQNTWKPSDKQMKSLRWVIEYGNTTQTETLKGIYEQLEKL